MPLLEALALRESLLPPKHLDLAKTRSELGGYTAHWRPDEGERLLLAALEVQREALGNLHPEVAQTLGFLSHATLGLRRPEEAENLARQSIEIFHHVFGPDSTESLESERRLAEALGAQQRPAEAEQVIRAALERGRRLLSPAHPAHANFTLFLSRHLENQNRIPEAERAAREALDLAQRYDLPGPAGQILQTVNRILLRLNKADEAERITRHQIELTRPRGDEYPLMLALHLVQLTRVLRSQGRHAEAEAPAREALALRERGDTKGWLTQSSLGSVGGILTNLGRYSEAEPFLISAYEGLTELERTYPTRTPGYFPPTYLALIDLYQRWGRADEGARWRQQALVYAERMRAEGRVPLATRLRADLEKPGSIILRPE